MAKNNPYNLTDKQERFCQEYLIDLNATQAAIRAGYSESTAGQIGEQNLKKLEIETYISELKAERTKRTEIKADDVVKELANIGFSKIDDYVSVIEQTKETPAIEGDDEHQTFEPTIITYKAVDIKLTKDISPDKVRAISSIKQGRDGIEIKLHDKVKSLELLGKHLGIFEKDNSQKQPTFNVNTIPTEDLNTLLQIQSRANTNNASE